MRANQTWTYANPYPYELPEYQYRNGIDVGAFVELFKFPYVSFMPEIHYVQKGFKVYVEVTTPSQPEGTSEFMNYIPRAEYISLPVLAKLRYDSKYITPYLIAGPRIDWRSSDGSSNLESFVYPSGTELPGFYKDFNRFDFGATIGVGIGVLANERFSGFIEARYSPSVTNAYKSSNTTVKNNSYEILLGLKINTKAK